MAKDLKVVVLGYMASGKTTVGRAFANHLDIDFVDLDHAIENEVESSVPEIFETRGELFFRKKETQVLTDLLHADGAMVLSLGGGTPCYSNNMEIVNQNATHSFYLKLSIGNLIQRISFEKEQRPLVAKLKDEDLPEFIGKHLFERNPFYSRAMHTLDCNGLTVADAVKKMNSHLG